MFVVGFGIICGFFVDCARISVDRVGAFFVSAPVKIGHYFDYRIIKRRAERIYDAGLFRADNQRLYYICVGRDSAQNKDNRYGDRVAQNGKYRRHEQFKVYVFYRFGNEIRQKSRDERGERSYENIVNSVT